MRHPDSLSPRDPDAGADQPDPQRFLGDQEIVQLEELLAGQRGTEVGVTLAHDLDGLRSQLVWQAPIARLAAFARARRPRFSKTAHSRRIWRSERPTNSAAFAC